MSAPRGVTLPCISPLMSLSSFCLHPPTRSFPKLFQMIQGRRRPPHEINSVKVFFYFLFFVKYNFLKSYYLIFIFFFFK